MYFPMFVDLEQKRVLVAGAGTIGTRRIKTLLEFGAELFVIAPEVSDEIMELFEQKRLFLEKRMVDEQDLDGVFLVVAATNQREVNHTLFLQCKERNLPINVIDKKEECSFYFPGIAKEGDLVAGICAGGKNHTLARKASEEIRRVLRDKFGKETK